MSLRVLDLVTEHCQRYGLPVPSGVVGSTDVATVQYLAIIKDVVRELGQYKWQQQKFRRTFTTTATELQGRLVNLFGSDYAELVAGSMWDETEQRPVFGPVGDASWEMWKAYVSTGPIYKYWISGDQLYFDPVPPAGHTIGFIVQTSYGVVTTAGVTKPAITDDSDLFLFPDDVVVRCFEYKWKKLKGEPWQDDYNDYMGLLSKVLVKDTGPVLSLDGSMPPGPRPGIWVPAGSWNVS